VVPDGPTPLLLRAGRPDGRRRLRRARRLHGREKRGHAGARPDGVLSRAGVHRPPRRRAVLDLLGVRPVLRQLPLARLGTPPDVRRPRVRRPRPLRGERTLSAGPEQRVPRPRGGSGHHQRGRLALLGAGDERAPRHVPAPPGRRPRRRRDQRRRRHRLGRGGPPARVRTPARRGVPPPVRRPRTRRRAAHRPPRPAERLCRGPRPRRRHGRFVRRPRDAADGPPPARTRGDVRTGVATGDTGRRTLRARPDRRGRGHRRIHRAAVELRVRRPGVRRGRPRVAHHVDVDAVDAAAVS